MTILDFFLILYTAVVRHVVSINKLRPVSNTAKGAEVMFFFAMQMNCFSVSSMYLAFAVALPL